MTDVNMITYNNVYRYVPAMVVSDKSYLFVTGNSFSLRPPSFNSPHRCASSKSFSSDLVISPLLRCEYSVDAQSIVFVPCPRTSVGDTQLVSELVRRQANTPTKRHTGDPCDGRVHRRRRKRQTNGTPSPVWSSDVSRNVNDNRSTT